MLLLNFAHPLTPGQVRQVQQITEQRVDRIIEITSHINPDYPLAPQVTGLADQAGLSTSEWQTLPLLINPPSLNFVAVTLLAELHGRCGYFPTCLRLRPVLESAPLGYEVAEVLNLQAVRDTARLKR